MVSPRTMHSIPVFLTGWGWFIFRHLQTVVVFLSMVAILPQSCHLKSDFNFSTSQSCGIGIATIHSIFVDVRCLVVSWHRHRLGIGCPVAGEEDAATAHRRRKGRQVPKVHRDLHGSRGGKPTAAWKKRRGRGGDGQSSPWKLGIQRDSTRNVREKRCFSGKKVC